MKGKSGISSPAVGGSSLLVIFGVLCLTVFAVLSLSTALSARRLSDANGENVAAYYAADLEAEGIFARLRNGETVPGVRTDGRVFCYSCPVSQYRTLEVALEKKEEGWTVLRWQLVAQLEHVEETLPVWDGS